MLELAFQCRDWNALPEPGAVLDQPVGLLKKMTAVLSAHDTISSRQRAKNVIAWIDADPKRNDYYGYLKMIATYGIEETTKMMAQAPQLIAEAQQVVAEQDNG